jgi:phage terminase small subunit
MTPRMQLFVNEYLISLNAADAARCAGYSERHAGLRAHALMRRTDVQLAIREAMDARARRTGITADRVLEEFAAIAFADMRRIIDWGPGYVRLRPPESMTDFDRAAIKSIKVRIGRRGCGHVNVRLHDKMGALFLLQRHLGMDKDAPDPEAYARLAERLRGRLRRDLGKSLSMRQLGELSRARLAAKRAQREIDAEYEDDTE